jgi:hypothetical protein
MAKLRKVPHTIRVRTAGEEKLEVRSQIAEVKGRVTTT